MLAHYSQRRRQLLLGAGALAMLAAGRRLASADSFPDRPMRFIVGFGAGGSTDIVARALADKLGDGSGWKVVIENRTGASGNIATQAVASAEPDGYTYLVGASPFAVNHWLFPDFPVKYGRDLTAIAPLGATANALVVHPSLKIRTLTEFITFARERPGAITYATLGNGSSGHLAGVAFDLRAGTKMVPVSYRGGGEALKDLLGGHVQAWFASIPSVLEQVRSGQLVGIATTGPQRASWLPDIATMAELGFEGFDVRLWIGVLAPAAVPAERLILMEQAIARAMAARDMQATLDAQGVAPFTMSRAKFDAFMIAEIERWRTVVASLGK